MLGSAIQTICVYAIPLIFAITIHEAAHGWAAKQLGDKTAWMLGRVTFNPVPHIDPVGTILVPAALVIMSALTGGAGFVLGWAKPVPINVRNFRHINRDMMLTALAGPMANLLQAILWALVLKFAVIMGINERFVISVAVAGVSVNLMLMAFNLIPIPPLDGGRILRGLLPNPAGNLLDRIEPSGMLILVILMAGGGLSLFARPFLEMGEWLVNVVL